MQGRAELVINFRELFPDKPQSAVRLFPELVITRPGAEISIDLSEDGVVLIGKLEFRQLAHMAEGTAIGRGRLVFPFPDGAPVYVVRELV
jgi:hypothetical protein